MRKLKNILPAARQFRFNDRPLRSKRVVKRKFEIRKDLLERRLKHIKQDALANLFRNRGSADRINKRFTEITFDSVSKDYLEKIA